MGKGKGALEYWVAVVKPGRVMFEIAGVPEEVAREALRLATHKLPCKCKVVSRADLEGGESTVKTSKYLEELKTQSVAELNEAVSRLLKKNFSI